MEALATGSLELSVSEVGGRASLMGLAPEWDELVRSTRDEVFLQHDFFRIWIDNFAPRARFRVLLAHDASGRLSAVLPLMEQRAFLCGVPVRQLVSTSNSHSCRFDLVAKEPASAGRAFLQHLRRDTSWDLLRLSDVPEGGNGWRLLEAAAAAGLPTGAWESMRSPYVPLPRSRAELDGRLDAKFRANCRRRRRRLEEKGVVCLEKVTGGEQVDAKLEEAFALEQSGWKGRRGTAISQAKATRGFYSELARAAKYGGYLTLFFLRLDGRPVASHFGLTQAGRYFLLKPAYDEKLAECSPGQLLLDEVLGDCIASGLRELDFLGPDMPWKRDWTDRLRAHHWLFVFRDTGLMKALCRAKFRWLPRAKEAVARWKR
ncbi:MAG: GNAT family N-acetyltransferase [Myxococcales bacterium]|nr:GNAT family N-acetyltransferase [Myxococcales bacterium]